MTEERSMVKDIKYNPDAKPMEGYLPSYPDDVYAGQITDEFVRETFDVYLSSFRNVETGSFMITFVHRLRNQTPPLPAGGIDIPAMWVMSSPTKEFHVESIVVDTNFQYRRDSQESNGFSLRSMTTPRYKDYIDVLFQVHLGSSLSKLIQDSIMHLLYRGRDALHQSVQQVVHKQFPDSITAAIAAYHANNNPDGHERYLLDLVGTVGNEQRTEPDNTEPERSNVDARR